MSSYAILRVTQLSNLSLFTNNFEDKENVESNSRFGGIFSNTKYAWLTNSRNLTVINTKTGQTVSTWTFGNVTKDWTTRINCVIELPIAKSNRSLLLVGLKICVSKGMVCIFEFTGSKILRAIEIPDEVTSIGVINSNINVNLSPGHLKSFDGVIAVGTVGGEVFLLDACLEACEHAMTSYKSVRDETNSCKIMDLLVEELALLDAHKQMANLNGEHLAIRVNDVENGPKQVFILKGPKGKERAHVNKPEVKVSALQYCPQLGSLLIGYNFGAWQLWDLIHMKLMYTSPIFENNIPVTHFALQEPCDDPRAFCYMWVIYSNTELFQPGFPMAVMYALHYDEKNWHESYGLLYQDFFSCTVRFQRELALLERKHGKAKGAWCMQLLSLNKGINKANAPQESQDDAYSYCFIAWNVWDGKERIQTFLSLFDLNQWYKEQMPNVMVLREREVALIKNHGSQKHLLLQMVSEGPICLIDPTDIYHRCIRIGLMPLFIDATEISSASLTFQRELILNIALEQQLSNWLRKCAAEWSSGSFSSFDCSLSFLLKWGWNRGQVLKQSADNLCVSLFDFSGIKLDTNSCNLLDSCLKQLQELSMLFEYILKHFEEFLSRRELIERQQNHLQMASQYLEVVQWFFNVGLLPEAPLSSYPKVDELGKVNVPYPVQSLVEHYQERRTALKHLCNEKLLFIDNLIGRNKGSNNFIQEHWRQDGGDGLYPPPSLQSLLSSYFDESMDLTSKHSIVTYLLLDLTTVLDNERYQNVIIQLIKFPVIFQLSPSYTKIVQTFWHLDRGNFAIAVEQLLDPLICSEDLKTWHHRIILNALLCQGQHKLALLYLQVRQPPASEVHDLYTIVSLYVANDMLDEALHFQRQAKSKDEGRELIRHFFSECDKKHQLPSILYMKLLPEEEEVFMKYLNELKHPRSEELKICYHLQRSHYLEAFDANAKSSKSDLNTLGLLGKEQSSFRNFLIKQIKQHMPAIDRGFFDFYSTANKFRNAGNKSTPLSTFLNDKECNKNYDSNFLVASVIKAREIWSDNNGQQGKTKLKNNEIIGSKLPFIKTPTTGKCSESSRLPVIYPKIIEMGNSGETSETSEDGPSPAKKPRLSPCAGIIDISKHLMLETPIIQRKKFEANSTMITTPRTPQSILKKKGQKSYSSSVKRVRHRTSEELIDDDRNLVVNVESTKKKLEYSPSPVKSKESLLQSPRIEAQSSGSCDFIRKQTTEDFPGSFSKIPISKDFSKKLMRDQYEEEEKEYKHLYSNILFENSSKTLKMDESFSTKEDPNSEKSKLYSEEVEENIEEFLVVGVPNERKNDIQSFYDTAEPESSSDTRTRKLENSLKKKESRENQFLTQKEKESISSMKKESITSKLEDNPSSEEEVFCTPDNSFEEQVEQKQSIIEDKMTTNQVSNIEEYIERDQKKEKDEMSRRKSRKMVGEEPEKIVERDEEMFGEKGSVEENEEEDHTMELEADVDSFCENIEGEIVTLEKLQNIQNDKNIQKVHVINQDSEQYVSDEIEIDVTSTHISGKINQKIEENQEDEMEKDSDKNLSIKMKIQEIIEIKSMEEMVMIDEESEILLEKITDSEESIEKIANEEEIKSENENVDEKLWFENRKMSPEEYELEKKYLTSEGNDETDSYTAPLMISGETGSHGKEKILRKRRRRPVTPVPLYLVEITPERKATKGEIAAKKYEELEMMHNEKQGRLNDENRKGCRKRTKGKKRISVVPLYQVSVTPRAEKTEIKKQNTTYDTDEDVSQNKKEMDEAPKETLMEQEGSSSKKSEQKSCNEQEFENGDYVQSCSKEEFSEKSSESETDSEKENSEDDSFIDEEEQDEEPGRITLFERMFEDLYGEEETNFEKDFKADKRESMGKKGDFSEKNENNKVNLIKIVNLEGEENESKDCIRSINQCDTEENEVERFALIEDEKGENMKVCKDLPTEKVEQEEEFLNVSNKSKDSISSESQHEEKDGQVENANEGNMTTCEDLSTEKVEDEELFDVMNAAFFNQEDLQLEYPSTSMSSNYEEEELERRISEESFDSSCQLLQRNFTSEVIEISDSESNTSSNRTSEQFEPKFSDPWKSLDRTKETDVRSCSHRPHESEGSINVISKPFRQIKSINTTVDYEKPRTSQQYECEANINVFDCKHPEQDRHDGHNGSDKNANITSENKSPRCNEQGENPGNINAVFECETKPMLDCKPSTHDSCVTYDTFSPEKHEHDKFHISIDDTPENNYFGLCEHDGLAGSINSTSEQKQLEQDERSGRRMSQRLKSNEHICSRSINNTFTELESSNKEKEEVNKRQNQKNICNKDKSDSSEIKRDASSKVKNEHICCKGKNTTLPNNSESSDEESGNKETRNDLYKESKSKQSRRSYRNSVETSFVYMLGSNVEDTEENVFETEIPKIVDKGNRTSPSPSSGKRVLRSASTSNISKESTKKLQPRMLRSKSLSEAMPLKRRKSADDTKENSCMPFRRSLRCRSVDIDMIREDKRSVGVDNDKVEKCNKPLKRRSRAATVAALPIIKEESDGRRNAKNLREEQQKKNDSTNEKPKGEEVEIHRASKRKRSKSMEVSETSILEYTSFRRLTRRQKAILEKSFNARDNTVETFFLNERAASGINKMECSSTSSVLLDIKHGSNASSLESSKSVEIPLKLRTRRYSQDESVDNTRTVGRIRTRSESSIKSDSAVLQTGRRRTRRSVLSLPKIKEEQALSSDLLSPLSPAAIVSSVTAVGDRLVREAYLAIFKFRKQIKQCNI